MASNTLRDHRVQALAFVVGVFVGVGTTGLTIDALGVAAAVPAGVAGAYVSGRSIMSIAEASPDR